MLKVLRFAKEGQRCFETQSETDCVIVKFNDGTFQGVLSWSALLGVLKRKVAEQEKAKREAEQSSPASIVKPKD